MKKILIIEDDLLLGDALSKKLTDEGFKVELAVDGLKGYELLKFFKPDSSDKYDTYY